MAQINKIRIEKHCCLSSNFIVMCQRKQNVLPHQITIRCLCKYFCLCYCSCFELVFILIQPFVWIMTYIHLLFLHTYNIELLSNVPVLAYIRNSDYVNKMKKKINKIKMYSNGWMSYQYIEPTKFMRWKRASICLNKFYYTQIYIAYYLYSNVNVNENVFSILMPHFNFMKQSSNIGFSYFNIKSSILFFSSLY